MKITKTELKEIISEAISEYLNEGRESAYPKLKYQQLLDLYDYLYSHGFKDELYSRHARKIPAEFAKKLDQDSKAAQTIGKINYKRAQRESELEYIGNELNSEHLYWLLTFDKRGQYATLAFNFLGTNSRDMERVKKGISDYCESKGIDKEQILPFLDFPTLAVSSVSDNKNPDKNKLTIKFKVEDPSAVSPYLKPENT